MTGSRPRELARFAAAVGASGPVAAEGARTRWEAGGQLAPGTRLVRAPEGILCHQPEEMTVAVLAGTPVEALHAALAERGQRSALPERGGTVGGALAAGENALSVLGRGRVRDALLQVHYVSADGKAVRGGGPTVKNVSGFDLPRLMVGSLGTLGLIGEVILRTNPLPPVSQWVRSAGADPFAVAATVLRPSAVLWDGTTTWVELEGYAQDVAAHRRALAAIGSWEEAGGPPPLPPQRWSLPPAALRTLSEDAIGPFVASVGAGTVFAHAAQVRPPLSPAVAALSVRIKRAFDPAGRLNPGRCAARRS